jgi:hypothetical protein
MTPSLGDVVRSQCYHHLGAPSFNLAGSAVVGYPHVKVRDVEAGKVVPIAEIKGRD